MARPLRIEYPGAVYHITSRGNGRMAIFEDDADQVRFLEIVGDAVNRFNWLCHTYCLMGNHYHLLIETIDANLSAGMRHVNGVYTQYYNRRHDNAGHVFQGRFKAILVEKENYLLELCRYVVLNPVRAGMVKKAKDYEWSSYNSLAGIGKEASFLSTDWILSHFGEDRKRAQRTYRKFIAEGTGVEALTLKEEVKSQCILGSDIFFERLSPFLGDIAKLREIPRTQRYVSRPSLDELFPEGASLDKRKRNELLRRAHEHYGYSYSEMGRHVGLHYATISRLIRNSS